MTKANVKKFYDSLENEYGEDFYFKYSLAAVIKTYCIGIELEDPCYASAEEIANDAELSSRDFYMLEDYYYSKKRK